VALIVQGKHGGSNIPAGIKRTYRRLVTHQRTFLEGSPVLIFMLENWGKCSKDSPYWWSTVIFSDVTMVVLQ
jgi:hypothetical protein